MSDSTEGQSLPRRTPSYFSLCCKRAWGDSKHILLGKTWPGIVISLFAAVASFAIQFYAGRTIDMDVVFPVVVGVLAGVVAYIAFFLLHLFYSYLAAPKRIYEDNQKEITELKGQLERLLKSPDFGGEIKAIYHCETSSQGVKILVDVQVVNPQGPASGVMDWRMEVKTNVTTYTGETETLLPVTDVLVSFGQLFFSSQDYAPDKMTQLLPAGSVSTGWFWSVFPDVRLGKLHDEGAIVVVSFRDAITGNWHSLKRSLVKSLTLEDRAEDRVRGQMTTIEKAK